MLLLILFLVNMRVLFFLLSGIFSGGTFPKESTVVSLFADRVSGDSWQVSWSELISFRGKKFQCSLSHDPEADRSRALAEQFRARMQAVIGTCFSNSTVVYCPMDSLSIQGKNFLPLNASDDQEIFSDSKNPSAIVTCRPDGASRGDDKFQGRLCREGEEVLKQYVITRTYLNGTVILQSIQEDKPPMISTDMNLTRCFNFGFSEIPSLMSLSSADLSGPVAKITVESPLCGSGPKIQLLEGGCWTGEFQHRQFEYCHNHSVRFVQLTHRLNHHWPTAVAAQITSRGAPWIVNSSTRTMDSKLSTDLSCLSVLPALTEEFLVTVLGRRFSIKGVSGSFTPLQFQPNFEFVQGALFHDSQHPQGCSESAWIKVQPTSPWIALVDRGGCLFQDKTLIAQRKGAAGIIVINNLKKGMIPAMAAMTGKPAADIPAVLVDTEGAVLKQMTGNRVRISPNIPEGLSRPRLDENLEIHVSVGCYNKEIKACQAGDQVLVNFDGDPNHHSASIVEVLNPDSYLVHVPGKGNVVAAGWQVLQESDLPCTVHRGTYIRSISRTDTCVLSVDIHSGLVCSDPRLREPLLRRNEIKCSLSP